MESNCSISVDSLGTKRYFNSKRELHRENDLPAKEYFDGSKYWYINGIRHRENGPASIYGVYGDEYEEWYLNDIEYKTTEEMPLNLFISYCKWKYNKHGK